MIYLYLSYSYLNYLVNVILITTFTALLNFEHYFFLLDDEEDEDVIHTKIIQAAKDLK